MADILKFTNFIVEAEGVESPYDASQVERGALLLPVAEGLRPQAVEFGNRSPIAQARVTGINGRTVALDASESSDPDGDSLTYAWTFRLGDEEVGTATGSQASFTFSAGGAWSAQVEVSDGDLSDTASASGTLDATAPSVAVVLDNPFAQIARVTLVSDERPGDDTSDIDVSLAGQTLDGNDFSGDPLAAQVDLGENGTFTATLNTYRDPAGNDGGNGQNDSVTISYEIPAPRAVAQVSSVDGRAVMFDGSETTGSPSGGAIVYEWEFYLDGTLDGTASGPTPTHTFSGDGAAKGVLTAYHEGGIEDTDAAFVTLDTTAPTVSISLTNPSDHIGEVALLASAPPGDAESDIEVSLAGQTLTASDFSGDPLAAQVDLGEDGEYTATLNTYRDADGNDGGNGQSDSVTITLDNTPPSASIESVSWEGNTLNVGDRVQMIATITDANLAPPEAEWVTIAGVPFDVAPSAISGQPDTYLFELSSLPSGLEGAQTLRLEAVDVGRNTTVKTRSVDVSPPEAGTLGLVVADSDFPVVEALPWNPVFEVLPADNGHEDMTPGDVTIGNTEADAIEKISARQYRATFLAAPAAEGSPYTLEGAATDGLSNATATLDFDVMENPGPEIIEGRAPGQQLILPCEKLRDFDLDRIIQHPTGEPLSFEVVESPTSLNAQISENTLVLYVEEDKLGGGNVVVEATDGDQIVTLEFYASVQREIDSLRKVAVDGAGETNFTATTDIFPSFDRAASDLALTSSDVSVATVRTESGYVVAEGQSTGKTTIDVQTPSGESASFICFVGDTSSEWQPETDVHLARASDLGAVNIDAEYVDYKISEDKRRSEWQVVKGNPHPRCGVVLSGEGRVERVLDYSGHDFEPVQTDTTKQAEWDEAKQELVFPGESRPCLYVWPEEVGISQFSYFFNVRQREEDRPGKEHAYMFSDALADERSERTAVYQRIDEYALVARWGGAPIYNRDAATGTFDQVNSEEMWLMGQTIGVTKCGRFGSVGWNDFEYQVGDEVETDVETWRPIFGAQTTAISNPENVFVGRFGGARFLEVGARDQLAQYRHLTTYVPNEKEVASYTDLPLPADGEPLVVREGERVTIDREDYTSSRAVFYEGCEVVIGAEGKDVVWHIEGNIIDLEGIRSRAGRDYEGTVTFDWPSVDEIAMWTGGTYARMHNDITARWAAKQLIQRRFPDQTNAGNSLQENLNAVYGSGTHDLYALTVPELFDLTVPWIHEFDAEPQAIQDLLYHTEETADGQTWTFLPPPPADQGYWAMGMARPDLQGREVSWVKNMGDSSEIAEMADWKATDRIVVEPTDPFDFGTNGFDPGPAPGDGSGDTFDYAQFVANGPETNSEGTVTNGPVQSVYNREVLHRQWLRGAPGEAGPVPERFTLVPGTNHSQETDVMGHPRFYQKPADWDASADGPWGLRHAYPGRYQIDPILGVEIDPRKKQRYPALVNLTRSITFQGRPFKWDRASDGSFNMRENAGGYMVPQGAQGKAHTMHHPSIAYCFARGVPNIALDKGSGALDMTNFDGVGTIDMGPAMPEYHDGPNAAQLVPLNRDTVDTRSDPNNPTPWQDDELDRYTLTKADSHHIPGFEGRKINFQRALTRYPFHWHIGENSLRGKVFSNLCVVGSNSHGYVQHNMHNTTLEGCVTYKSSTRMYTWDVRRFFTRGSHWDRCWAGRVFDATRTGSIGGGRRSEPFALNNGWSPKGRHAVDANVPVNKTTRCGVAGMDVGGQSAAYAWPEGSLESWIFQFCYARNIKSNVIFVWQNVGIIHIIEDLYCDQCGTTIEHGAYGNNYLYRRITALQCETVILGHSGSSGTVKYQDFYVRGSRLWFKSVIHRAGFHGPLRIENWNTVDVRQDAHGNELMHMTLHDEDAYLGGIDNVQINATDYVIKDSGFRTEQIDNSGGMQAFERDGVTPRRVGRYGRRAQNARIRIQEGQEAVQLTGFDPQPEPCRAMWDERGIFAPEPFDSALFSAGDLPDYVYDQRAVVGEPTRFWTSIAETKERLTQDPTAGVSVEVYDRNTGELLATGTAEVVERVSYDNPEKYVYPSAEGSTNLLTPQPPKYPYQWKTHFETGILQTPDGNNWLPQTGEEYRIEQTYTTNEGVVYGPYATDDLAHAAGPAIFDVDDADVSEGHLANWPYVGEGTYYLQKRHEAFREDPDHWIQREITPPEGIQEGEEMSYHDTDIIKNGSFTYYRIIYVDPQGARSSYILQGQENVGGNDPTPEVPADASPNRDFLPIGEESDTEPPEPAGFGAQVAQEPVPSEYPKTLDLAAGATFEHPQDGYYIEYTIPAGYQDRLTFGRGNGQGEFYIIVEDGDKQFCRLTDTDGNVVRGFEGKVGDVNAAGETFRVEIDAGVLRRFNADGSLAKESSMPELQQLGTQGQADGALEIEVGNVVETPSGTIEVSVDVAADDLGFITVVGTGLVDQTLTIADAERSGDTLTFAFPFEGEGAATFEITELIDYSGNDYCENNPNPTTSITYP